MLLRRDPRARETACLARTQGDTHGSAIAWLALGLVAVIAAHSRTSDAEMRAKLEALDTQRDPELLLIEIRRIRSAFAGKIDWLDRIPLFGSRTDLLFVEVSLERRLQVDWVVEFPKQELWIRGFRPEPVRIAVTALDAILLLHAGDKPFQSAMVRLLQAVSTALKTGHVGASNAEPFVEGLLQADPYVAGAFEPRTSVAFPAAAEVYPVARESAAGAVSAIPPAQKTNGYAVAAFVLALVSCVSVLSLIAAPLSLILARVAFVRIDGGSGERGRGLAKAAVIIDLIIIVVLVIIFVVAMHDRAAPQPGPYPYGIGSTTG